MVHMRHRPDGTAATRIGASSTAAILDGLPA
jgi:hypothetical protein